MGILFGGLLIFQDRTTICTVADKRKVEYEGKAFSLSKLIKQLLGLNRGVSGTRYWTHEGRSLSEIRDETYMVED